MASYNNNNLLSNHQNYMSNYIGGEKEDNMNLEYIQQQSNIIKNNNRNIPNNFQPPYNDMYTAIPGIFGKKFPPKEKEVYKERYDPLTDFLFKKGLQDRDNATSYNTEYINIDSSYRNKVPIPTTDEIKWIKLNNSPLKFEFNSNLLQIIDLGNESQIRIDDKIMIDGVQPIKRILKTVFENNDTKLFEFTNGSKYLKINYKHFMKFPDTYPEIFDYNKFRYIEQYDTRNVEIEIIGIQGINGTNYIGNIPITTLNTVHQVLLFDPTESVEDTYSDTSFYIELTTEYSNQIPFILAPYNIDLIFYYIAGVPINQINAEYPIDIDHAVGYHRIIDISSDSFIVELPKVATLVDESICANGETGTCVGGNTITIAKIEELLTPYPEPNHYSLKLPKVFNQVVYIRMISSEFPNVQKNIISNGINKNNKLYWQNLEDGDKIYNIDIETGTYDPTNLKIILENKIKQIKRIFSRNINENNNKIIYLDNNIINIDIDEKTNIVSFQSFTQAIVAKPFTEIYPPINNNNPSGLLNYSITITQQTHRLKVGDIININNSLSHMGIPNSILNGEHIVNEIINDNQYKIIIKNFNLETERNDTGGGSAVHILTPNVFRLRFDFLDTLGNLLGFRNSGSNIAITKYSHIITNKDEYAKELNIDEEGNIINFENNSLLFSGDNYILVTCKQIKGILNFGEIKGLFAKIQLPDATNSVTTSSINNNNSRMVLNTFVDAPIYFHKPIRNLNELEFELYTPSGELYDFDGLDHSFTLEIVTMSENPKGTGITSFSGKIN